MDLTASSPALDVTPSLTTKLPADRRGRPPAQGIAELRAAIAESLLRERGLTDQEILVTHGVAGGFSTVLDAFVNRGDRVVLFDPCSPLYHWPLASRRARIRWIPTWIESGRTRFRLDLLARALRGARLIVVNSPSNPTGGVLAAEDLECIAWWAKKRDALIFNDEVYEPFRYEGDSTSIGSAREGRDRTLTASSLSMSHGLASARVGWLAGHRGLLHACLSSARLHTPCVPTVCQQIALAALKQPEETLVGIRDQFASRRQYVLERLQAAGLKPLSPAGGFFIWITTRDFARTGKEFAARLSADKKVLVTPGEFFGPSGKQFIRLSYAGEEGRLREGLGRLASFVSGKSQKMKQAA
jgi:aspartate/methionine/tyrosine aminotransferase